MANQDGASCSSCASALAAGGIYPVVLVDSTQATLASNQQISATTALSPSSEYWAIPFTTSGAGVLKFQITASSAAGSTPATVNGIVLVNWIAGQSGYTSTPVATNSLSAGTGLLLRSVTGVSSSWISLVTTSSFAYVVASPDEFKSAYQLTFSLPTNLYSSDMCTGSSLASLYISDVAYYSTGMYLLTNGGLVYASGSAGLSFSSRSSICIKKMKRHQQEVALRSYWDPLVVIGGSSNEGQVMVYSNQTYLATSNLVDASGNALKSALFPGASSLSVLDSATFSVQPNLILFLVAVNSASYYLVSFDMSASSWAVVFKFPSTIPSYTSSSANTFLAMWNTTDSIGAFDGLTTLSSSITLSLTGLATSASSEGVVFVLGNGLFYSSNIGQTMNLVQSSNSYTFTSLTSHPNGEWAVETSTNELWIGNLGTNYLAQASISRNTNSYVPFFDYSGTLYELSYASGSLSRSPYSLAAVVGTTPTCAYTNVSFLYQTDLQKYYVLPTSSAYNSTQPTSWVTTSYLPSRIYLDYTEKFSFQVRIMPTTWSSYSAIAISIQISNATLFSVTYTKDIDFYRKTVVVSDLGVGRASSEDYLVSSLRLMVVGDTLSCQDFASKSITLYSGCHPTSSLVLNPYSSSGLIYPCPYSQNGLPCAKFTNTFVPVFYWTDFAQNLNVTFNNPYTINVVGGGSSNADIAPYSSGQINSYNPSASNVWTSNIWVTDTGATTGIQVFDYASKNGLIWKCHFNSPCHYIASPTLGSPSIYYITLQVSGVAPTQKDSYCSISYQFQLALVSIPPPLAYQIATIVSVCAFSFVLLAGTLYYYRNHFGLGAPVRAKRNVSFVAWPIALDEAKKRKSKLDIAALLKEDEAETQQVSDQPPEEPIPEDPNQEELEKEWFGEDQGWYGEADEESSEDQDGSEELEQEYDDDSEEDQIPLGKGLSASLMSLNKMMHE
ncbi:hypothetical protein HDV03_002851 [Kappamyces sp. JEL0829]|nr:hypothetical protein HDV03_002851 [Kappamyces sp. JEL0829]